MTGLDWIILAFALLMAVWGYLQGLIVGALSLVGFAVGALLGSRLGPLLLDEGSHSPYAPLFALVGALLVGGILASGLEILGFHLRRRLGDRLGVLDGVGGALLVAALGLGIVWIAGSVALQTPGAIDLRGPIQRSVILRELNATLPPSGPLLKALARFDPFPRIDGPRARRAPARLGDRPRSRRSCREPQRGQGPRHGLRARRAGLGLGGGRRAGGHERPRGGGPGGHDGAGRGRGTPPRRRRRLVRPATTISPSCARRGSPAPPPSGWTSDAKVGTSAAVLGFPGNGPYDVQPGRLGPTRDGAQPGRLRPRTAAQAHHLPARPRAVRATPGARWWTAAAGS